MGSFFNEFAVNLYPALIVFAGLGLPTFGYFYNQLMNKLDGKREHTSLYVAIGVSVTLLVGGLFSWKSALMNFALFGLSGLPMIFGEFKRTELKHEKEKTPRRKRMPYAANGRIDDANMSATEASRLLGMALREKDPAIRALQLASISHELHNVSRNLLELKMIQQIEE